LELATLEELEEQDNLSFEQACRKIQIQEELLHLLEKEEAFWQQRSKEQWLLHGDNNTSYFHRIANGSKRKRTMFSLRNGSENIQGTPALLEHATSLYKNLFGPVHDAGVRLRDEVWDEEEKLNEDDRINLDRSFTKQEIHDIIYQM
jgi:hypothetical protein